MWRGGNLKEFIQDIIFFFKLETCLSIKSDKADIYIK